MHRNKKILVTGAAGFIGFHIVNRLCKEGYNVIGVDNLNDYYDVSLKEDRLKQLNAYIDLKRFILSYMIVKGFIQVDKVLLRL